MTRKIGLSLLCTFILVLTACGVTSDGPVTAYCDALEKHTTAVKDGKFDKAAFEKEMTPLVAEVVKHKDSSTGKIPMSEKLLERWQKCIKDFAETASSKNNIDALNAQISVMKPITDGMK